MAENKVLSPRITAGPITDLGVGLESVVKLGFVEIMRTSEGETLAKNKLSIFSQYDAKEIKVKEGETYLKAVYEYLNKEDMYIAHARTMALGVVSGDLYKSKSSEK